MQKKKSQKMQEGKRKKRVNENRVADLVDLEEDSGVPFLGVVSDVTHPLFLRSRNPLSVNLAIFSQLVPLVYLCLYAHAARRTP